MADDDVEELQESLSKFVSVAFGGARIKALLILPKAHYMFPAESRTVNASIMIVWFLLLKSTPTRDYPQTSLWNLS